MHFCLQTAMNKGQFLQHDFVMLKTRTLLLTPQAWKTHRVLWLFVLGRTTVTVACLNFCFRWTWIASFTTRNFNIDGMSFPIWKAIFQNTQVDTSRVIFSEFPIKHHPLRTTISIFLGIVEFTSYIIAYFCSYRTWQPPKKLVAKPGGEANLALGTCGNATPPKSTRHGWGVKNRLGSCGWDGLI